MNNHPKSRRARALRVLGIVVVIVAAILAAPIIIMKLIADVRPR